MPKFSDPNVFSVWVVPVIVIVVLYVVQFSIPQIIGADGYLHWSMRGVAQGLPQAKFSWFANYFSDKDFIYHLALLPFSSPKFAAWFFGAFFIFTFAFISQKLSGILTGSLVVPGLLLSSQFLRDISEPRPVVLAMALSIIGLWSILNKKYWLGGAIALFYGMTHLSGYMMIVMALITRDRKMTGFVVAGWLLSFLIHPNFPHNIYYFYLNGILVPWYAAKTGVLELGAEFFPLNTQQLVQYFPLLIPGLLSGVYLWVNKNIVSKQLFIVWSVYLFLGLVARKNLTLGYPFFLLWLASVLKDKSPTLLGLLLTFLIVGNGTISTYNSLQQSLFSESVYNSHFEKVANWLKTNIPAGETIFHTNWSDSQYLIGLDPKHNFIVTLDPIYMYSWNPDLYKKYRDISFGNSEKPYEDIKKHFGAKYGYAGKNYFGGLITQIRQDKTHFTILAEDYLGVIFRLE